VFARAYVFGGGDSAEEIKRRLASANPGSLVQAVKGGRVKNELLVELLAAQTFRAEASGSMLARKPEIDLLLRVAGTTQISRAIRGYGVVAGEGFLAINAGRNELRVPDGFGKAELPRRTLTAPELLMVERGALLNAQRG